MAGGTLVSIARIQPGFTQSQGGRGLAHFVDAMLAPSDEEDADMIDAEDTLRRLEDVRAVNRRAVLVMPYHADFLAGHQNPLPVPA